MVFPEFNGASFRIFVNFNSLVSINTQHRAGLIFKHIPNVINETSSVSVYILKHVLTARVFC